MMRDSQFVTKYYLPNKYKNPKGYAHHLIFIFHPFRSEL